MFRLTPDSIAYLNIARNYADGCGFVSTIKLHCLTSPGVLHSAFIDWPPLYPFVCGLLFKITGSQVSLQVANALLASVAAGLVYLISVKVFDRYTALLSGVFALLAPNLYRAGIVALSDALGLVLALCVVLIAIYSDERPWMWCAAGLLAGLALLVRYPNGVLIIGLILYIQTAGRTVAMWRLAAGLASIIIPVAVIKTLACGSPLRCIQILHYTAPSFSAMAWGERPPFTDLAVRPIIAGVLNNAASYLFDLLLGNRGLFLLVAGLPLFIWRPRRPLSPQQRLMLLIAGLNFVVYALTWSIPAVRGSRFLLLSYCLLLPFCCTGIVRALQSRLRVVRVGTVGVCLISAGVYCWGCVTAACWSKGMFAPVDAEITAWMRSSLPAGTTVASNNPWMVNYSTNLPAAILPHGLDRDRLQAFIELNKIGAVVIFKSGPNHRTLASVRESGDMLEVTEVGAAIAAVPRKQRVAESR